jgi:hypothetical protein
MSVGALTFWGKSGNLPEKQYQQTSYGGLPDEHK